MIRPPASFKVLSWTSLALTLPILYLLLGLLFLHIRKYRYQDCLDQDTSTSFDRMEEEHSFRKYVTVRKVWLSILIILYPITCLLYLVTILTWMSCNPLVLLAQRIQR